MLARLAERVLADGGRLLVVSADGGQLGALDQALWTYRPESFLPHGQDDSAAQPVLLARGLTDANGARAAALVDGQWRDEALAFDRVFHLFDEAHVDDARAAWRTLGARDGVTRSFWQRGDDGGWTRAA